jgi:hypothetical protein
MSEIVSPTSAARNAGVTGQEIAAYAIAQAIKIAASYALSYSGMLIPIYMWAAHYGGLASVWLGLGFSLVYGGVTMLLFLALRGSFGGVPAMISGTQTFTSSGGEIGAFVIAYAVGAIGQIAINTFVLNGFYIELYRSGQRALQMGIGATLSVVTAAIVFAIFIGLRAAFCRR